MSEVSAGDLKLAVEYQHGGRASFVEAVPVRVMHGEATVWDGIVSVFELIGPAKAKMVYAWSILLPDGERQFFAVARLPPIDSPIAAVRAAIAAEQQAIDVCPACKGNGVVIETRPLRIFQTRPPPAECPECNGTGSRVQASN